MDKYILNNRNENILYMKDKIKILEMSEDDILEITQEYYRNINNEDKKSKAILKKQKYFWKKLLDITKNTKFIPHSLIHLESDVSITYLKNLEKSKDL